MQLTHAELIDLLPADMLRPVKALLHRASTEGIAAYRAPDGSVSAFPVDSSSTIERTRADGSRLVGVHLKDLSAVRKAIRYMQDNPGVTPTIAARLFGIKSQTIAVTLRNERRKQSRAGLPPVCPCCGQPIPETNK